MPKQHLHSDQAGPPLGAYSQGIRAGDFIFVSGCGPIDAQTAQVRGETVAEQTHVALDNVTAILAAGGAGLAHVVRVGIVMRHLEQDRPIFNEVWAQRFGEHRPARSAIESPAFGRPGENARFMIEVAAYRG